MTSLDRIPVIVGVGEVTDDPDDILDALEPLALMSRALRAADDDAGGTLLAQIDSIDVVNQISWRYAAPAHELCRRLNLEPRRINYGIVGGETPIRFLHEAAARIWRGESDVAAICGGEAHRSAARAAKEGVALPWSIPPAQAAPSIRGQDRARPLARALGAHIPATVYPLFENALAHRWGQSPREALAETGRLWAAMSASAADNDHAWLRRPYSAEEIVTTTAANRMIAEPYRKLMVANIGVNQGAAVLLTSLGKARAAGLDDGRLVFIHQGFSANEPDDALDRDGYDRCHARDVVLEHCMTAAGAKAFDAIELYSCFPCVTKAARRTLGLAETAVPTVTGGLTFFGAPLNNYMSHAVAAMTRRLRRSAGHALLYGQGGFATKHHGLIIGSSPGPRPQDVAADASVQRTAASRYGEVPSFKAEATGPAVVESHTVVHARDGSRHGIVVVRVGDGGRSLARVREQNVAALALLENPERFAIGMTGEVRIAADSRPEWMPS